MGQVAAGDSRSATSMSQYPNPGAAWRRKDYEFLIGRRPRVGRFCPGMSARRLRRVATLALASAPNAKAGGKATRSVGR
ncbi:MAG: hypothetical protein AB7F08_07140, partial [Dongiaceae bacterium]